MFVYTNYLYLKIVFKKGTPMKKRIIFGLISTLLLSLPLLSLGAQTKGIIKVIIKDTSGREVGLYKGSHALLIGANNYTVGWPKLHSVPDEIKQVEAILKSQGFHVVNVMNPTGEELSRAFEDFIDLYGFDQNNRLLFFFSGHGYTRKDGQKGYLVPTDAPNPNKDMVGFLRRALPMNQILAWSRQVEAKHALFLFDSCFSGTVFKAKDLPERPPHISRATTLPVRQYITAGDARESVPAKSVFTPAFIDALDYGWGDLNGDGYVSGTELGLYLQEKVPQHSRQNPQYGKIKDYELARGDFIFALKSSSPPPKSYDRIRKERKQLEREKRELERLRTEIDRKELEEERKRLEAEKKKYDIAKLPPKPKQPPSASAVLKDVEIARDGSFIAYANGTVLDTKTNLIWADTDAGASPFNHSDAKSYCEGYRGGGHTDWRMPTVDELETLYNENLSNQHGYHITRLINVGVDIIWADHVVGAGWGHSISNWVPRSLATGTTLGIGAAPHIMATTPVPGLCRCATAIDHLNPRYRSLTIKGNN